jgi:short-subunit dehydrogenase
VFQSYIKSFTEALRIEYAEDNITVQHLFPLFVNTKMNAFSYRLQETSLFVPDAKMYAVNAVNTLGMVKHSTGYWAHGIQVSDRLVTNYIVIQILLDKHS